MLLPLALLLAPWPRAGGVAPPCEPRPCLWFCCPNGQVFESEAGCVSGPRPAAGRALEGLRGRFRPRYEPVCPGAKVRLSPVEDPVDQYELRMDGWLLLPLAEERLAPGDFCVVASASSPAVRRPGHEPAAASRAALTWRDAGVAVLRCLPSSEAGHPDLGGGDGGGVLDGGRGRGGAGRGGALWQRFLSAALALSALALLATLLVFALLPELRTRPARLAMGHAAALAAAYIALAAARFAGPKLPDSACVALAFIIYFSFLASFFWLNVMCLDIWWTFSGYRPMRGSVKEREHKKFIIYSLYCWGGPLIMLTICMIMDLHPGIPDSFKKPGFGKMKCWFETHTANLLYFNGPIAVLIVCNIVLFICTAFKIQKLKQETKILKKQDSRRHNEEEENNTQRFVLYLKLFLVMGVNWSMEVISFAIGGKDWWWYLTDIANTLQGVLIFVIFVWKDRIWRLLRERFCPQPAASVVSSGNTTSTHTANTRISSSRASIKRAESEQHQMKRLVPPPSARADDSDIA